MARERHAGFLARSLAQQARLGIRGAGMRLVAAAFSSEVHRRVARIVVRGGRCRCVPGPEALEPGGGLDQGPVHAEVLVRQQPLPVGRPHHLVEQGPAHIVVHQALSVLGDDRGVEAALHQVHVQEPAVQQVVPGSSQKARSLRTE